MAWSLNADRPIYSQIVERLETQIVSGQYKPGDAEGIRGFGTKRTDYYTKNQRANRNGGRSNDTTDSKISCYRADSFVL